MLYRRSRCVGRSTKKAEEVHLRRFFSAFPGGWPGVGLLFLRAAVGITALLQGGFYLAYSADSTARIWLGGIVSLTAGAALLIGILTPVAGILLGLEALGVGFSILPAPSHNLFDARLSLVFAAIITVSIVFLGPGAFSLDARLFGRREIIIPQGPRRPAP
jgi:uncharacterized membrane protein YphA (DoxX/SURF4 family)